MRKNLWNLIIVTVVIQQIKSNFILDKNFKTSQKADNFKINNYKITKNNKDLHNQQFTEFSNHKNEWCFLIRR